jgi:NAD(P)-dependent dehydrogenase (short-subunit alcohol dehydrogenase family)
MMKPVALVIGASRGIGRQIAVDLALNGYNVVLASKTTSADTVSVRGFTPPDPNSRESTIHTVCAEINILAPSSLVTPIPVDVRSPSSIQSLIDQAIAIHSRIDVLVYNAGAIHWGTVASTPLKRFNLLQQINPNGLYATIQKCLPCFEKQGWRAKVIVVCPPIYQRFFRGKVGYAMGKVGMSVLVKGLGMEWEDEGKKGMSICGIWPASVSASPLFSAYQYLLAYLLSRRLNLPRQLSLRTKIPLERTISENL